MAADNIWSRKYDEEVLAAYAQLSDYTDEGQGLIRAEIERRQLVPLVALPVPAADAEPFPSHPIAKLWAGGYSLPVTYWIWGQAASVVWAFVFAILPQTAYATAGGLIARQLAGLAFVVYQVLVGVGVWRSADHYRGSPGWATLAKVAVIAPVAMLVMRTIFGAFAPGSP